MSTLETKLASEFMKNLKSLVVLSILGSVLMGCPQNGRQSDDIQPGTLGYRGGIQFEVPSTNGAYSELAAMPYAIAKTYPGVNGRMMMAVYIYENQLASGANPCVGRNETQINQQPRQRSFTILNLDVQNQTPQIIYSNPYGSSYHNYAPWVQFQMNDSVNNLNTIETNFTGAISVRDFNMSNRTALVQFDNVTGSSSCFRTPQNQSLACGSRISGQILVGLCW